MSDMDQQEKLAHEQAKVNMDQGMREHPIASPLTTAVKIAFQNLKIRFGRSIITIGGIFFAIAFLTSVLTTAVVNETIAAIAEGESVSFGIMAIFDILSKEPRQAWLVIISLLVCVIGIANAMLMSVTERYKEIGTMKCLGALDVFVIELFLLESGLQGLIGSFLGSLAGVFLILLSTALKEGFVVIGILPWVQIMINVLLGTVAGVILTLMGAGFPAFRASLMVPADAMRTEV
jgi:putative ABC transport system permease protein